MKQPVTHPSQIPDKVYFRIGEVSNLIGVDSHVLRYWETEFKNIKPHRAKSNQRLYRKQDVEILLQIRSLLHEQGYTISGARKAIAHGTTAEGIAYTGEQWVVENGQLDKAILKVIKNELYLIKQLLESKLN